MIREWGSPTHFLTFSCAECESPDIENYLRKVNDVPPSYNIGKLCTEDPISVSHKFSLKFHTFYQNILILRVSGGWGSLVHLKLLDALGKRMDHFKSCTYSWIIEMLVESFRVELILVKVHKHTNLPLYPLR